MFSLMDEETGKEPRSMGRFDTNNWRSQLGSMLIFQSASCFDSKLGVALRILGSLPTRLLLLRLLRVQCPDNCSCFHDSKWTWNKITCSASNHTDVPSLIPMDATENHDIEMT